MKSDASTDFLDILGKAVSAPCGVPVPQFKNIDVLNTAVKEGKWDFKTSSPYILQESEVLKSVTDERGVKASVGIYKIQFPSGEQAKTLGRGQMPFTSDRKIKAQELMTDSVACHLKLISGPWLWSGRSI